MKRFELTPSSQRHRRATMLLVLALVGGVLVILIAAVATAQRAAAKKAPKTTLVCHHLGRFERLTHTAGSTEKGELVVCVHAPTGASGKAGTAGPAGPVGPPGPVGPQGPAGGASAQIIIPSTTIPFTTGFQTDGGNVQNLATVGPIHIDGLCRKTSSPGTGTGVSGGSGRRTAASFLPTSGGETEAQVIVWTETASLSFRGAHGPRTNIPPGPPDYTLEVSNPNRLLRDRPVADPVAGEGDHLFVAAANENVNETVPTDPQTDNPDTDMSVRRLNRYPAFDYAHGIIATSDGHLLLASMLAGFDTLGVYDSCVFTGTVRPLS